MRRLIPTKNLKTYKESRDSGEGKRNFITIDEHVAKRATPSTQVGPGASLGSEGEDKSGDLLLLLFVLQLSCSSATSAPAPPPPPPLLSRRATRLTK